jgi:hypothetical protein
MGDASEVVREVSVNDFRMATEQQFFHLDHRLLGIAPGTVRVLFGWKRADGPDRADSGEAEKLPHGKEREALLRKARQLKTASQIDQWLSSPALKPPE